MPRVKIELPGTLHFTCLIPVRITDINYGGHVGNDSVLGLIHEARMQFFTNMGYTELNFGGTGMIMADVAIEFKNELFYGDTIIASVGVGEISKIGFDLYYKLEKEKGALQKTVAIAKTGMICYDYDKKKIVPVPAEAAGKLL
jgi:acyl-CoA thioester hydrolase